MVGPPLHSSNKALVNYFFLSPSHSTNKLVKHYSVPGTLCVVVGREQSRIHAVKNSSSVVGRSEREVRGWG